MVAPKVFILSLFIRGIPSLVLFGFFCCDVVFNTHTLLHTYTCADKHAEQIITPGHTTAKGKSEQCLTSSMLNPSTPQLICCSFSLVEKSRKSYCWVESTTGRSVRIAVQPANSFVPLSAVEMSLSSMSA